MAVGELLEVRWNFQSTLVTLLKAKVPPYHQESVRTSFSQVLSSYRLRANAISYGTVKWHINFFTITSFLRLLTLRTFFRVYEGLNLFI